MIDFGDKLFAVLPAPTFARRAQASVRRKVAAWQVRPCDMAGAMVGTTGENDGDALRISAFRAWRKTDAAAPWGNSPGRQFKAFVAGIKPDRQRGIAIDCNCPWGQVEPGHYRIGRGLVATVAARDRRLGQGTAGNGRDQDRCDRKDRHVQRVSEAD